MDGQDRYSSRMTKRKNKKVNKVYNILITVVVLLIIAVGATIFLGNNDEPSSQKANTNPDSNQTASNTEEDADNEDTVTNEDDQASENIDEESTDQDSDQDSNQDPDSPESDGDEETVESEKVEETTSDSNVEEAYSNPSWKAVGTEQSGEHVTQFEQGSTDWNEMERAIAYGAGIDQSNMTLWYLQNGGEPNKAIGTVSPKDESSTYRVYIEWVDGEGWKPTKVEKLIKNDKK